MQITSLLCAHKSHTEGTPGREYGLDMSRGAWKDVDADEEGGPGGRPKGTCLVGDGGRHKAG